MPKYGIFDKKLLLPSRGSIINVISFLLSINPHSSLKIFPKSFRFFINISSKKISIFSELSPPNPICFVYVKSSSFKLFFIYFAISIFDFIIAFVIFFVSIFYIIFLSHAYFIELEKLQKIENKDIKEDI